VVLLPGTGVDGAVEVAGKLRELIRAITLASVSAGITASLGVAALPLHAATGEELIRAADRALYAARAAGRDRVEVAGMEAEAEPLATGDSGRARRQAAP
jgi:two-component system, cell cycle response regulator